MTDLLHHQWISCHPTLCMNCPPLTTTMAPGDHEDHKGRRSIDGSMPEKKDRITTLSECERRSAACRSKIDGDRLTKEESLPEKDGIDATRDRFGGSKRAINRKDRLRRVDAEGIGFVPIEGIGCMPMNGTCRQDRHDEDEVNVGSFR